MAQIQNINGSEEEGPLGTVERARDWKMRGKSSSKRKAEFLFNMRQLQPLSSVNV